MGCCSCRCAVPSTVVVTEADAGAEPTLPSIADAGVIFRRGELFAVESGEVRAEQGEEDVFMRASFSSGPLEDLGKAMQIFATVLVEFFQ